MNESKNKIAAWYYFNSLNGQHGYLSQTDIAVMFGTTVTTLQKHWREIRDKNGINVDTVIGKRAYG